MKMCIALVEIIYIATEVNNSTTKIRPINIDLGFFKWKITILTKIDTIQSMDGVQLVLCMACEDKQVTWNP